MKNALIFCAVASILVVAFVEGQKLQCDSIRKSLVAYINNMAGISETDLTNKKLPELLDMAIVTIRKHIDESKDASRSVMFNEHLKYYQGIKDELDGKPNGFLEEIKNRSPKKLENPPTVDPNQVSSVYHVESEADFNDQVKNAGKKVVVVDFFATWCGPCKTIAPYLEKYAKQYASQVVMLKVDVDELSELSMNRFGVTGMPTFVFFMNGEIVKRFSGADTGKVEATIKELVGYIKQ